MTDASPSVAAGRLLSEVEDVLSRGLPDDVQAAAFFDADGTLWEGDLGLSAFRLQLDSPLTTVKEGPAASDAGTATSLMKEDLIFAPLQTWASEYGLSTCATLPALHQEILSAIDDGSLVAHGVKQGRDVDDVLADVYAMHAWSYAGFTETEVENHGDAVYRSQFKAKTFPSTHAMVAGLKALAVECFVVSASPELVLRGATADLGIASEQTFGMATATGANDVVLPNVRRLLHGPGKADLVSEVLGSGKRPLLAFGDSADGGDKDLLASALLPVAVAPTGRHLAHAKAQGMRLLDPMQT